MTTPPPRLFSGTASGRAERPTLHAQQVRVLRGLVVTGFVWAGFCLVLQGQDGFFAVTVERVESPWLALTFLNIPLHLTLNLLAGGGLVPGASPQGVRAATAAAGLATALIAGHVVLSFVTA